MIGQDFIKEDVVAAFGSPTRTAEFFGIDVAAVSQWRSGHPIPELRRLEIQLYRPDLVSRRKARKVKK